MKQKIVVIGNGWLGNRIAEFLGPNCKLSKSRVHSVEDAKDIIGYHEPDVVINATGRTGVPNIDWCETHKEETLYGNLTVPLMIADACMKKKVRMVHLGTGCIYQGDYLFKEHERANFDLSYYSKTKYLAEQALLDYPVLQLRIRMPIDNVPSPRNLITKLLSYDNLISCPNSITVVPDFLSAMKKMIVKKMTGVYNVVNNKYLDHDAIVDIYNQYAETPKRYTAITILDLNKIVASPRSNCTLSIQKLEAAGIVMPDVKESLHKILKEYAGHEKSKRNPR